MMNKKFGDAVFKLRGAVWTALFLVIYSLASPTGASFFAGLPFVVAGQAFRIWAAGCIGRYRGEVVGAQKLATTGAYSLMRNPLYFANGLIGFGWGVMAGWAALAFFVASFVVVYIFIIIPREEDFLRTKFGAEFDAYCERTARFHPRARPNFAGDWDSSIILKSERYSIWMTVLGTILLAIK